MSAFLALLLFILVPFALLSATEEIPSIKVGHVGHDHQVALYAAIEAGKSLEKDYGVYFKPVKEQEVYDLYDKGSLVARVQFVRVGGGAKMPAALEQGHIEVGLGGIGPVVKFMDKGSPMKILAPLNNDGDALVLRNAFSSSTWDDFAASAKKTGSPLRIGYKAPLANAYMIFTRALKDAGISYGQEPVDKDGRPVNVIMVNLQEDENALAALEGGIVDGVVINEPYPSLLVHKGVGRRLLDLSGLPPKGKWQGHPCCVVAASEQALREKRGTIKSLLKAIAAGADRMAMDGNLALSAEAAWTKTPPEVGRESLMHVTYVITPDEAWLKGVESWIGFMAESGHIQKNLKGKSVAEVREAILDLGPMRDALSEIRLASKGAKGKAASK
jgi:NitT/TauT family transport system substrate-binding protein